MSDVQVWTLIGVFAATMFGVIGIITTSFTKTMNAGFAGVGYRIEAVESRLEAKIEKLDAKLSAKIDLLDRDISVIAHRVFPEEPT